MKQPKIYHQYPEYQGHRYSISAIHHGGTFGDNIFSVGVCRTSKKDQFIKVKGRTVSEGRAKSKSQRLGLYLINNTEDFHGFTNEFIQEFDKKFLNHNKGEENV